MLELWKVKLNWIIVWWILWRPYALYSFFLEKLIRLITCVHIQIIKEHYPLAFSHLFLKSLREAPEFFFIYTFVMQFIMNKSHVQAYSADKCSSLYTETFACHFKVFSFCAPFFLFPCLSCKHCFVNIYDMDIFV